ARPRGGDTASARGKRDTAASAHAGAAALAAVPSRRAECGVRGGVVSLWCRALLVAVCAGCGSMSTAPPDVAPPDATPLPSDASAVDAAPAPDAAAADAADAPCPADMLLVGATCMDRFEAPNVPGALPLVMYTFVEAEAWCGARGKRLCFED